MYMDNEILRQAISIINEKRRDSIEKNLYRKAELEKNEKYNMLMDMKRQNALNISKALKNNKNIKIYEDREVKLDNAIHSLKKQLGLEDKFYCEICNDTGKLNDGRFCSCLLNEYNQIVRENNGLLDLPTFTFSDNSIENIDCKQRDILIKLYKSCYNYAENFPNNDGKKNIVLIGNVGTGKTCLLSAIANMVLKKGHSVTYLTAFTLSNKLIKYHTTNIHERDKYINGILDTELLIIDDLGTEPILKNISTEYLYNIVNSRVNKHTIIATNLSLTELNTKYGERIVSRLTDKKSIVLKITGDDLRIKK